MGEERKAVGVVCETGGEGMNFYLVIVFIK
jgi:hypothetical protein